MADVFGRQSWGIIVAYSPKVMNQFIDSLSCSDLLSNASTFFLCFSSHTSTSVVSIESYEAGCRLCLLTFFSFLLFELSKN